MIEKSWGRKLMPKKIDVGRDMHQLSRSTRGMILLVYSM
jgi:hypothetical protein